MKVFFTEFADLELDAATEFYNMKIDGLGEKFRAEVESFIRLIIKYPDAWSTISKGIRKCLLHKFPYMILYSIEEDHILVLAIAHQHQKPDYWVDRDRP